MSGCWTGWRARLCRMVTCGTSWSVVALFVSGLVCCSSAVAQQVSNLLGSRLAL